MEAKPLPFLGDGILGLMTNFCGTTIRVRCIVNDQPLPDEIELDVPDGVDRVEQLRCAAEALKRRGIPGVDAIRVGRGAALHISAAGIDHAEFDIAQGLEAGARGPPPIRLIDIYGQLCTRDAEGVAYVPSTSSSHIDCVENSAAIRREWTSRGAGAAMAAGGRHAGRPVSWIEQAEHVRRGGKGTPTGTLCAPHMDASGVSPIGFLIIEIKGGQCSSVEFVGFVKADTYTAAASGMRANLIGLFYSWGWDVSGIKWKCTHACGDVGMKKINRSWMVAWCVSCVARRCPDMVARFEARACKERVSQALAEAYNRWMFEWGPHSVSGDTLDLIEERRQMENDSHPDEGVTPKALEAFRMNCRHPHIGARAHVSFASAVAASRVRDMIMFDHTGHLGHEWLKGIRGGSGGATYGSTSYVHEWVYCVRRRPGTHAAYDEYVGRIPVLTDSETHGAVRMVTMRVFAEIQNVDHSAAPTTACARWSCGTPSVVQWQGTHPKWAPVEAMDMFVSVVVKPRQPRCAFIPEARDIMAAIAQASGDPGIPSHPVGFVMTPEELGRLGIEACEVSQSDEHAARCSMFGRAGTSASDSSSRLVMALENVSVQTCMQMLAAMTPCVLEEDGTSDTRTFTRFGGVAHFSVEIRRGDDYPDGSVVWRVAVQDARTQRVRNASSASHVGAFSAALNTIAEIETLPPTFLMRALNTVPLEHERKSAYRVLMDGLADTDHPRAPGAWMNDIACSINLAEARITKKLYDHVMGRGAWAAFVQNPIENQVIAPRHVARAAHINSGGGVIPHYHAGACYETSSGSIGSLRTRSLHGEGATVRWDCSSRVVRFRVGGSCLPAVRFFADDLEYTTSKCYSADGNTDIEAMSSMGILRQEEDELELVKEHPALLACGVLRIRIWESVAKDTVDILLKLGK